MSVAGSSLGASATRAGRHLEHTVITLTAQSSPTTVSDAGLNKATASGRSTGPAFVIVRDGLWRVVDRTGAVLGHIERQQHSEGERYLARRIVMSNRRIDLGAFWRMQDAADCFR
jgi:hypothetical protein